ncbi:SAC3 family protein 1 [Leucoagaricus sp. SymC.cos]|nr:SAC3 family protein 1 [Leucoagaricus sp. SymC.cos]
MNPTHAHGPRIRGAAALNAPLTNARGRPHSRNKQWTASGGQSANSMSHGSDGERWERGGGRGGIRSGRGRGRGMGGERGGRKFPNQTLRNNNTVVRPTSFKPATQDAHTDVEGDMVDVNHHDDEEGEDADDFEFPEIHEPELETQEEREKFYQELVRAREVERKKAIADGKMDDPLVPKRLEDAITMVGTCLDMCPRFERYRRERENNLFEWETIPGTKRVDHKRAVKMYERAAGDKTLPSDLRPPKVLKASRTLDYLFHDLLPRGGFSQTYTFIRDRSRAVRNDFTMQHESGSIAIECHDRCARFHILALHFERDKTGFSIALEEQQLMNTLQSLKEFYTEQRPTYNSPTELEMRVYHRLIHIRDQRERPEDIPNHITSHPVFKLTTLFRLHVQAKSAPITKTSLLVVDEEGMRLFGQLAQVLREEGSVVMIYLVACILERLFGKDTIEDIEAIRGELRVQDIIDGKVVYPAAVGEPREEEADFVEDLDMDQEVGEGEQEGDEQTYEEEQHIPQPSMIGQQAHSPTFFPQPPASSVATSAFGGLTSTGSTSVFGGRTFGATTSSTNQGTSVSSEEIPGLSTSPPTVLGAPGSNPFQPQTNGTSVPAPAPSSFFTPPTTTFPKPVQENKPDGKIPSFFITTAKTQVLNPAAQAFKPSSIFAIPAPSTSMFSTLPPTAPTLSTRKKSITPPSLHIDTRSVSTPPPSEPIIPMPVPPTPQSLHTQPSSQPQPQPQSQSQPQHGGKPPSLTSEPTIIMDTSTSSPMAPPPLRKQAPVSLPGTPSTITAVPHPILGWRKSDGEPLTPTGTGTGMGGLTPGVSGSGASVGGYLSPLDMSSGSGSWPGSGLASGSASATSSPRKGGILRVSGTAAAAVVDTSSTTASSSSVPKPIEREKTKEEETGVEEEEYIPTNSELKLEAQAHFQTYLLSKYWTRWNKKHEDVLVWAEAVESSDKYRVKKMKIRTSKTVREGVVGVNMSGEVLSPSKKRQRKKKRISDVFVEPRTDEEIAKRFQENRAENQELWAQGSYLSTIRTYIHSLLRPSHQHQHQRKQWNIWLSLNPESDSSAIWLEKKFDVPKSGRWADETVFEIPLVPDSLENERVGEEDGWATGLIVFECTPVDRVADEIERKYCVLDDCARLRDIIDALSPKRHYIPSLLILNWGAGVGGDQSTKVEPAADFLTMVKKYVNESVLAGYATVGITTTANLDSVLTAALKSIKLDVEGRLVRSLTLRGLFRTFEEDFSNFLIEWLDNCSANGYCKFLDKAFFTLLELRLFRTFEEDFSNFLIEWLDNCSANGYFDWILYAYLVQATIGLLNKMATLVSAMLSKSKRELLPSFDVNAVRDSDTAYQTAFTWLSRINDQGGTEKITVDLQSHINIGQDFPARTFIQHLLELTVLRTEKHANITKPQEKHNIPAIDLKAASELFEASIQPFQTSLSLALNMSVRRSPKRRGMSEESVSASPEAKRLKIAPSFVSTATEASPPVTPYVNGRNHSPSPSIISNTSMALTETPAPGSTSASLSGSPKQITVAMLRALTRDMKKKYGSPQGKGVPSTPSYSKG